MTVGWESLRDVMWGMGVGLASNSLNGTNVGVCFRVVDVGKEYAELYVSHGQADVPPTNVSQRLVGILLTESPERFQGVAKLSSFCARRVLMSSASRFRGKVRGTQTVTECPQQTCSRGRLLQRLRMA